MYAGYIRIVNRTKWDRQHQNLTLVAKSNERQVQDLLNSPREARSLSRPFNTCFSGHSAGCLVFLLLNDARSAEVLSDHLSLCNSC